MSNTKNLIGSRIGKLEVLERKREKSRTYYYCKCDCGNNRWIRADSLTKKHPTQSCGCLGMETEFKAKDIKDKRYGRLIALKATTERDKYNGCVIWECICKCGNLAYVAEYLLEQGAVKSCGCLAIEDNKWKIRLAIKAHLKKNIVEKTNIKIISRTELQKNNKSGVAGVYYDEKRSRWVAQIRFKNRQYNLGRYKNKEDAIKAREKAKEELHIKFLEEIKNKTGEKE